MRDGLAAAAPTGTSLALAWGVLGLGTALVLYLSSIQLPLDQQLYLGWGTLVLIFIVKRATFLDRETQRLILAILCFYLTLRYWIFRTFDTLGYPGLFDFMAMLSLYLAESYGITCYLLGIFVNIHPVERPIIPIDLNDPNLPTVDVLIPTYNEPELMVATTATAAARLIYPKHKLKVYILDDGGTLQKRNDPDPSKAAAAQTRYQGLKDMAAFLEINYLTRERNLHAKAGNVSHALFGSCGQDGELCYLPEESVSPQQPATRGDIVLILDCDHVPTRDILLNTVGQFMADEKLFLVQTPHFFINPDPVEKNLATFTEKPSENEMFYGGVQLGLDFWNASFFCGSAALLRRKHLEEIGGFAGDTITEDAETALTLHARGLNSAYIGRPMVCGLSPETFSDFILQRSRWAQGMTQILMLKNPLFMKGLSWPQRLCYFNSCLFWLFGLARVVFFTAPLCFLYFGLNIYNASLTQVLAYAVPHMFGAIMMSDFMFGHVRHPFFSELYETVQCVFNVPALISTIFRPRSPSFKVTPKAQSLEMDQLSSLAMPFYVMLILTVIAYPAGVLRVLVNPEHLIPVLITWFWNTLNLVFVLLCLGAVWEKKQIRKKHRMNTDEAVEIGLGDRRLPGRVLDISEDGVGLTTAAEAAIKQGDEITLIAQDSYGHTYNLPLKVVRAVRKDGKLSCGCEFMGQDGLSWIENIAYVYGDSGRWSNFWQNRRRHKANAWKGLIYLFGKGVTGSVDNFAGLTRLLISTIRKHGEAAWLKLRASWQV